MGFLKLPGRVVRDLPIGFKLAITVVGAISLLIGVSLFALDRLRFVTAMQRGVVAETTTERKVQLGLIAAQELRVVTRELQLQQTVGGVRSALDRATKQSETATGMMRAIDAGADQPLVTDAVGRLDDLLTAVRKAAALRTDLLTARQKRLFQVRPTLETAMMTLMNELARGDAMGGGVDSVRASGEAARADQHDPAIEAANRYRLDMSRIQAAVTLFMATGNGSAANEIRDATAEAAASMAAMLTAITDETIRKDAQVVETIGKSIAVASSDLLAMSRQLDQVAGAEVEAASQAMRAAFEKLAETAADRGHAASNTALAAADQASENIRLMMGAITVLIVVLGTLLIRVLAGPIRRLTRIVRLIAGGKTDEVVPFTDRNDEIGQMAASVETLRAVMRQTFIQTQMIEQLPVGVMTAETNGGFRVTYANAEARQFLEAAAQGPVVGQMLGGLHPDLQRQQDLLADPANLPLQSRIGFGAETFDLRISAVHDRDERYVGPLLTWRRVTGQVRLVQQFEESVGAIARTVSASAEGMRTSASDMRHSAVSAGERTLAVSAASDQASHSVSTAAAGAEEVAVSVAEIARQVAESAQIASAAVSEALATDACVSGLSDAADRISAVVRLISDIAGRTNLLALNATIEAARAGDAGKGFAVVAGEVKNLATQTAKATEEIGGQIAAMQHATSQAVTALRSISGTIQRMHEIASVIAGSVEEQGAATASIAEAVQHAAAGTAEVNNNIAAVTHVVEETGSRAGGVLEAATAMAGQAGMLRTEVAKFLTAVQQVA